MFFKKLKRFLFSNERKLLSIRVKSNTSTLGVTCKSYHKGIFTTECFTLNEEQSRDLIKIALIWYPKGEHLTRSLATLIYNNISIYKPNIYITDYD